MKFVFISLTGALVQQEEIVLTVFFIWPEGRLWGSVNGKCLTEAKAEGI